LRKFKSTVTSWQRDIESTPEGLCKLCGGKGRYKITYKYKNPIFHLCWQCRGTGKEKSLNEVTS